MRQNNTRSMALAAMLTALSFVLMLVLSPFTVVTSYIAALLISCIILIECGTRYALISYVALAALTLLFLPDKVTAVWYVAYFGIYPCVKQFAERFARVPQWIIKAVYGVIALAVLTVLLHALTSVSIPIRGYIAAVPAFVVLDIAITQGSEMYIHRLRKIFNNKRGNDK